MARRQSSYDGRRAPCHAPVASGRGPLTFRNRSNSWTAAPARPCHVLGFMPMALQ
jgi:hypothetical protein